MSVVHPDQIKRRGLCKAAALVSALAFSVALGVPNCFSADPSAGEPNLIQQENAREGTTD